MKKRFAPNKIGRLRPPEQARESEKSPSGQREGDDEAADSPDEERGRKKACDQDKNQPSAGTASEESTSPVAQKSPGCKKSRTTKIREAPDKAVMTMRELIYYNPSANPMSTKFDDTKKPDRLSANPSPSPEQRSADQEKEEDEEEEEEERDETRIVPQLRIKDGKIVVDQQSLMVTTTTSKDTEILSDVVIEGPGHTTSSSYRCKYKATKWTKDETRTFFTALGKVGTDFTMMTLLLPKRTRKELKNKFKKEEKSNPHLISQALKVQQTRPIRT